MTNRVAANDMFARRTSESLRCGDQGIDIPEGHVGPVLLSDTGRTVWWTGRVAIGLRYQPQRCMEPMGHSSLWIQSLMLGAAMAGHEKMRPA